MSETLASMEDVANLALKEGKGSGCSDVSVIAGDTNSSQVRFSNNTITLVNNVRNVTLDVYLAKDMKRIVGSTYNPTEEGVKKFVHNLLASCEALPPSEDYTPLPQGPFRYQKSANFDRKVAQAPLVDHVKQALDKARLAGANRVSGSLNSNSTDLYIVTSAGAVGHDKESKMLLNVRAFAEDSASGHGLSCASYTSNFDAEKAGWIAGDYAKRSLNPKTIPEGRYDVVFTPTVVANILPVADEASAFSIESGISFLEDKLEKRVGVQPLTVENHGVYKGGLGGRVFDDEGTPTRYVDIVSDGTFRSMLHNSTTAKKFRSKSTGNAGIIAPYPISIVFGQGEMSLEDMIRETKDGVFITNNWYTRYQNYRSGEYSTVPRDAAFTIKNGELGESLAGLRVSDSIPRQLSNIEFISHERQWIKWWEVSTPTLAPAMMIKGVQITRAVGS
jgi:PmbA protein